MTDKINVFKNKNFSLLFGGVLVSNIAHILFNFAISLYVLRLAGSVYDQKTAALIQAIYLALSGFVLLLLMPVGGVLADKLNKVRTMYITDFVRGTTILLACLSLFVIDNDFSLIIILFVMNLILSVNSALFTPASSSLLRFIVKDEELQQASAYLYGSSNFQAIIGVLLGGILYASVGIIWIFLINGIGYIISAITEIFIRYDHSQHTSGDTISMKAVMKDIKDGLSYIVHQKAIFATLLMALGVNFFLSPIFANALPYFIEFSLATAPSFLFDQFLTPETWYSVLSISLSLSAIIMSIALSRRKTRESYHKWLRTAISVFVVLMSCYSLSMILFYGGRIPLDTILPVMIAIFFLLGFANTAFNVPIGLIFQRRVDKSQLGKVNSVSGVLSQALIPVASLIAGVLISQVSVTALYLFSLFGTIFVTLLYVTNKSINEI